MAMSPAALLLLSLLPASVAGSGTTSRLQIDLGPALALQSIQQAGPPSVLTSLATLPVLRAGATLFLRPVTDDATPLPLQPYLQSAGTLSLRLGGSLRPGSGERAGSLEVLAEGYPLPALVVGGAFGLDGQQDDGPQHSYTLPGPPLHAAAWAGYRTGDLQLALGYRYAPRPATVPSWLGFQRLPEGAPLRGGGGVTLGVRAVLVEHIDLRLDLAVSLGGDLYGGFRADYHASRRLGLLFGVEFAHGPMAVLVAKDGAPAAGPPLSWDRFGGVFGLGFWWTPRLALTGLYRTAWEFLVDHAALGLPAGRVGQELSLELSTRI